MSVYFVIADDAGCITNACFASIDNAAEWPLPDGHSIVMLTAPLAGPIRNYRIVNGEAVERDTIAATVSTDTIAADGIAECVIAGLPDPCRVAISGAVQAGPAEVTGGTLTLTSTVPGAIRVAVTADPTHKPWETTIHAA